MNTTLVCFDGGKEFATKVTFSTESWGKGMLLYIIYILTLSNQDDW